MITGGDTPGEWTNHPSRVFKVTGLGICEKRNNDHLKNSINAMECSSLTFEATTRARGDGGNKKVIWLIVTRNCSC